jgi:pseudaminic acid biosynthesis-associated methylase
VEQEAFWAGEFGDAYTKRNQGKNLLASNLNFFSKSLLSTNNLNSCIEFGANIGMNLKALQLLYPNIELNAIEINKEAAEELTSLVNRKNIFQGSISNYDPVRKFDLVIIKGVLIHINPDQLMNVYNKLVASCKRYILVAEYYNPSPVAIPYRGHTEKLFKRDFAGEMLDNYSELSLKDYGFIYHRDPTFPQDDLSWFLLEKN